MRMKMSFLQATAMSAVCGALLAACGDDSNSSSSKETSFEVNEYKSLPDCKKKNDAEIASVDSSDIVYVCKDSSWEILDTDFVANDTAKTLDDIPDCSGEETGNSYFIEKSGLNYICVDEHWVIATVDETAEQSSSSTAKSSSSAEGDNVAETLDDIPNCTESRAGLVYHVTSDDADYICENRSWGKVATCGSKTYNTGSQFCADGALYALCGGKSYDVTSEYCADSTVKELCGGLKFNEKKATCVDDKVVYFTCETTSGDFSIYRSGDTIYFDRVNMGAFMNGEGGCLYMAEDEYKDFQDMASAYSTMSKESILKAPSGALLLLIMAGGGVGVDIAHCDSSYTLTGFRVLDESFTEDDVYDNLVTVNAACAAHEYEDSDIKNCKGSAGSATLADPTKQFCYQGAIYDRCGGTTFATSSVYNPTTSACTDGKVVEKALPSCGSEKYDSTTSYCDASKKVQTLSTCGTAKFNPEVKFCFNKKLYSKTDDVACIETDDTKGDTIGVITKDSAAIKFCLTEESLTLGGATVLAGVYKKSDYCYDDTQDPAVNVLRPVTEFYCGTDESYSKSEYGKCGDGYYKLTTQYCLTLGETSKIEALLTDARDNKTYKTVTIGTQVWMAENLNLVYNPSSNTKDTSSYCYNNDPTYCATYGRLYSWGAAMDSAKAYSDGGDGCGLTYAECNPTEPVQGICPTGWHLPSNAEFKTLHDYAATIIAEEKVGTSLKDSVTWTSGVKGTDQFGFATLAAGMGLGGYIDQFGYINTYAAIWTSTESDNEQAYSWELDKSDETFTSASMDKDLLHSIRCIKD